MPTEDFVPAGSAPGWYRHPTERADYYYTGNGFGTVNGTFVRRPHTAQSPDFEPMDAAGVAAWVRDHGVGGEIPLSRIVTLDHPPGGRVMEILGLITELASASGWTAESKGNQALGGALAGLVDSAFDIGGNAILGVKVATFGAHGGLTSGFGGDAVGVCISGTVVIVEKDTPCANTSLRTTPLDESPVQQCAPGEER